MLEGNTHRRCRVQEMSSEEGSWFRECKKKGRAWDVERNTGPPLNHGTLYRSTSCKPKGLGCSLWRNMAASCYQWLLGEQQMQAPTMSLASVAM